MPPAEGNCWNDPLKTKSDESSLEVLCTDVTKLGMGARCGPSKRFIGL
jgi:hypothetical protein